MAERCTYERTDLNLGSFCLGLFLNDCEKTGRYCYRYHQHHVKNSYPSKILFVGFSNDSDKNSMMFIPEVSVCAARKASVILVVTAS
jgi:hypothetical protein